MDAPYLDSFSDTSTRPATASVDRALLAATALGSAAIMAAFCIPLLSGEVIAGHDLWKQFLPYKKHIADTWAEGGSPLWFPGIFGGYFLQGEGTSAMFHPLTNVLYRVFPLQVAFNLEILVWYPVMFAGWLLFLRRLGLSRAPAAFGAMAFAFSVFNLHRLLHPNALAIIGHLPWLLLCADVCFRPARECHRVPATAAFALLVGSQHLLGYPQYFWMTSLTVAAHALHAGLTNHTLIRGSAHLLAGLTFGTMLGAAQLLPTASALEASERVRPEVWSPENVYAGSTTPRYLLQAFSGYTLNVSHKQRIYGGAVPLVLSVWAAFGWRRFGRLRHFVLGTTLFGAVSIWLATGHFGGLARFHSLLPFVQNFRYPSRYFLLTHIAAAVLSAFAVHDLLRRLRDRSAASWRRVWPVAACGAASVAVTALAFALRSEQAITRAGWVLFGLAAFALTCVLVTIAARGSAFALVLLPVALAVDNGIYGLGYSVFADTTSIEGRLAAMPMPSAPPAPGERVEAPGDSMTLAGWRQIGGICGLIPYRRLDYSRDAALRVGAVRWVFESEQPEIFYPRKGTYREVPSPLPRTRLVSEAVATADPASDIERIDVERVALVEQPVALETGPKGVATIVRERPGEISVRASAPTRQLLILAESFSPGWRVRVDSGPPQTPLRAYGDFMATPVEAGDHEVRFEFRPKSVRIGTTVSWIALALIATILGAWTAARVWGRHPVLARNHSTVRSRPAATSNRGA